MPLLQPPSPDLRSTDLSYTHAYNSIVSRVHRSTGSGSGGVVILAGVDVVRWTACNLPDIMLMPRTVYLLLEYWSPCSDRTTFLTAWCPSADTLSSKRGATRLYNLKK